MNPLPLWSGTNAVLNAPYTHHYLTTHFLASRYKHMSHTKKVNQAVPSKQQVNQIQEGQLSVAFEKSCLPVSSTFS